MCIRDRENTSRRTGLQLGLASVTEANNGDFTVRLKREPRRVIDDIIADIRAKVNQQFPQLDVEFIQVLQDQIGDLTSSPEPIEIKLFSPDPALLKLWRPNIDERIKKSEENNLISMGSGELVRSPIWSCSTWMN